MEMSYTFLASCGTASLRFTFERHDLDAFLQDYLWQLPYAVSALNRPHLYLQKSSV